jgi:uncharacterized protein (DUF302 family)
MTEEIMRNRTRILCFATLLLAAILLAAPFRPSLGQNAWLLESKSRFSLEETVRRITSQAIDGGWKVPIVHDLQHSMKKAGRDVLPVRVVELCNPEISYRILGGHQKRLVTALMPCRVSVYEKKDGSVYVSRLNSAAFADDYGETVADAMNQAGRAIEEILKHVIDQPRTPDEE